LALFSFTPSFLFLFKEKHLENIASISCFHFFAFHSSLSESDLFCQRNINSGLDVPHLTKVRNSTWAP
jgi:hypothetical protein